MEDSMDMENMAPLRPQNFLFGCELKADKREFRFRGDDDDNEHQLSLRTVSLGSGAKDELNIVEAEGMSYDGKPIKIILASLKPSVQPTVSLGGFEITPPVTLRLKSGSGPIYISGQHLVALDEDLESEEEDEDDDSNTKVAGKRAASGLPAKLPQKKAKLAVEDDDDDEEEDDEDEENDDEDEDDEEESPVKKPVQNLKTKAQDSSQNGKVSKPSTPVTKQKTPEKKPQAPQTPKTPKGPLTVEEIKAKMLASAEKGVALPKVESKFQNYVKNCFRSDDTKIFQELWKWRQTLKDGK
ncbi:nucleophosmin [Ambystoma mexicanum]|uniref:nucleophosmin-like n=1 Tax=Ailuropoda melanoleuca TaxID=9646 RepID=UPI001494855E|nr:nucleophosmin-like [Ailuropoda melanoleuca]